MSDKIWAVEVNMPKNGWILVDARPRKDLADDAEKAYAFSDPGEYRIRPYVPTEMLTEALENVENDIDAMMGEWSAVQPMYYPPNRPELDALYATREDVRAAIKKASGD